MKFGKKLKTVSKIILIVNLCTMKKYLKAEIISYSGKTNKNSDNNKWPNEGFQIICSSVILIDSVVRIGKNF